MSSAPSTAGAVVHSRTPRSPPGARMRWSGPMRTLPPEVVFCRADARALGWSDSALTRAVRSGRLLRLRRDCFTSTSVADPVLAAVAAARSCHGSFVSDLSALLLHGLPLVGPPPPVPALTVLRTGTGDVARARLFRAGLREHDISVVGGVPVTSVARTVVDVARHHPIRTAVAAMDHALHHELTTGDELADVVAFCRRWPGGDRAARAVALADGRAESPLESISRLTIAWLGLPAPDLQRRIRNDRGVIIARTDFYWDDLGVVGEADGRAKFERDEKVDQTWERHDDLDALGLQIARWGWLHATAAPLQLDARIRAAFERGRRRNALALPRRWSVA